MENIENSTCRATIPDASQYLSSLSVVFIVTFSLFGLLTLFTILLYCDVILFISRHLKDGKPKRSTQIVLAVYPVLSFTGYISLLVPRSSGLNDMIAATYLSICVYVFMGMLIELYGGPSQMIVRLAGSKIEFSVGPLCCFFRCLPRIDVTSTRLRMLRLLILQYAIVRPLLGYVIAVMWSEISYGKTAPMRAPTNYLNLIYFASSLLATWGLVMIYRLSNVPLQYADVQPKFVCFQIVVIISGLQRPFFTVLVMGGILACEYPLSVEGTADRWNHMMLIGEMFLLVVIARIFYRRPHSFIEDTPYADAEPDVLTINEAPPDVTATTAIGDQRPSEYQEELHYEKSNQPMTSSHVTTMASTSYGSIVANSVLDKNDVIDPLASFSN